MCLSGIISMAVLAVACVLLTCRIICQRRYVRISSRVNDEIFRSVAAYVLLIDPDFNVHQTNYYTVTGTAPKAVPPKVGNLLRCKNGEDAGVCGTHDLCADWPRAVGHCRSVPHGTEFLGSRGPDGPLTPPTTARRPSIATYRWRAIT